MNRLSPFELKILNSALSGMDFPPFNKGAFARPYRSSDLYPVRTVFFRTIMFASLSLVIIPFLFCFFFVIMGVFFADQSVSTLIGLCMGNIDRLLFGGFIIGFSVMATIEGAIFYLWNKKIK